MLETLPFINAPPSALPLSEAIPVLRDLLYICDFTTQTQPRAAIMTALFVLRLLEKGDLTYEPLP